MMPWLCTASFTGAPSARREAAAAAGGDGGEEGEPEGTHEARRQEDGRRLSEHSGDDDG